MFAAINEPIVETSQEAPVDGVASAEAQESRLVNRRARDGCQGAKDPKFQFFYTLKRSRPLWLSPSAALRLLWAISVLGTKLKRKACTGPILNRNADTEC